VNVFAVNLGLIVIDRRLVLVHEVLPLGEEIECVIVVVRSLILAHTTNDVVGLQTNDGVIGNVRDPRTESGPRGTVFCIASSPRFYAYTKHSVAGGIIVLSCSSVCTCVPKHC